MNSPRITYIQYPNVTPEGELNALEAIYRRAIKRYDEVNEGGATTAPDDAKGSKHDRVRTIIQSRPS